MQKANETPANKAEEHPQGEQEEEVQGASKGNTITEIIAPTIEKIMRNLSPGQPVEGVNKEVGTRWEHNGDLLEEHFQFKEGSKLKVFITTKTGQEKTRYELKEI